MCGCIKEATGTMTHACHVPSRAKPLCLQASMSTVIFCQKLIVQVQVSCNTMAASLGTVSTMFICIPSGFTVLNTVHTCTPS